MAENKKEYRVIVENWRLTPSSKARKMERHLRDLAKEGWSFAAVDPMLFLGIDIGFYLILERDISGGAADKMASLGG